MSLNVADLLARAGLDPAAYRPVVEGAAPADPIQHAWSAALARFEDLVAEDVAVADPVRLDGFDAFDVRPVVDEPGVYVLGVVGAEVVPLLGAVARTTAGHPVFDARAAPVLLRLLDGGEEYLLAASGAEVAVRVPAEPDWEPVRAVAPPPPDLSGWTARYPPAPWLRDRLDALEAAGRPYEQVAAAGTFVRLWVPATPADRLRAVRERDGGPVSALREWARTLPADAVQTLGRWLAVQLDVLQERLDDPAPAAPDLALARFLAERRDAAESVALVLHHAGDGPRWAHALAAVGAARWTDVAPPGALGDVAWLAAVAATDPDAWWAGWARP